MSLTNGRPPPAARAAPAGCRARSRRRRHSPSAIGITSTGDRPRLAERADQLLGTDDDHLPPRRRRHDPLAHERAVAPLHEIQVGRDLVRAVDGDVEQRPPRRAPQRQPRRARLPRRRLGRRHARDRQSRARPLAEARQERLRRAPGAEPDRAPSSTSAARLPPPRRRRLAGALIDRRVPAAHLRGQAVGVDRAPAARLVLVHRRHVAEDRLHDLPRGVDAVLAREQRGVALHRLAQQPFVGSISSSS